MNKLILLAPLIAGIVDPVASTGLSPNLLAGYSPLFLRYNIAENKFNLSNVIGGGVNEVRTLMEIELFEPDAGFYVLNFDYYTTLSDYIDLYAVNINVNGDIWNVMPTYMYSGIDNTYNLDFMLASPYEFDYSYNVYVGAHTETGRTGFYVQYEDYSNFINDIKISIDILDLGDSAQYAHGYDTGYDLGYDTGYDVGYDEGENNALVNTSFVDFIINAVGGFMDFEIFPNFSIGGLLGAFVGVFIAVILLRVFAGG